MTSAGPGLSAMLRTVIQEAFRSRLERGGASSRVQLTLHGLPNPLLDQLFKNLTDGGRTNFKVSTSKGDVDVLVLLVSPNPVARVTGAPALQSHECSWEAVTYARNSLVPTLVLAYEETWGSVQPSVEDAMEPLGPPGTGSEPRIVRSLLWGLLLEAIEGHLASVGIDQLGLRWGLESLSREALYLPPNRRLAAPWDALTQLAASTSSIDEYFGALGLPRREDGRTHPGALEEARRTLGELTKHLDTSELDEAFRELAATPSGSAHVTELDALKEEIQLAEASSVDLRLTPSWVFRSAPPLKSWFRDLSHEVLESILDEAGKSSKRDRVELQCLNPLVPGALLPGEPRVVDGQVDLSVQDSDGAVPAGVQIVRGVGRSAVRLPLGSTPGQPANDQPPLHVRKQRYIAAATDRERSRPVYVLSLRTFGCHGFGRIDGASKNEPPKLVPSTRRWQQRIAVPLSGVQELEVLHATGWTVSEVNWHGAVIPVSRTAGPNREVFLLRDLQDQDQAEIVLKDGGGQEVGWTLQVVVDESEGDLPCSYFDALVAANQRRGRIPPVQPREAPLRTLEAAYLASPESWRPVLAGWSSANLVSGDVNWSHPQLGDIAPQTDPRPSILPPAGLLAAREQVRMLLSDRHVRLPEIDLGDPAFSAAVESYLVAFLEWIEREPEKACWFDTVAVSGRLPNPHAGRPSATSEPVAILLSPLHPLRLAWHHVAQKSLRDALTVSRGCPVAGLLDPHKTPDAIGLAIHQGERPPRWRTYFSLSSDEPLWCVLVNRTYIGEDRSERRHAFEMLGQLGLRPRSMAGGFSASQAVTALEEVSDILAARAVLRVGIVGAGEADSSSAEGVVGWCEDHFDDGSPRADLPSSIEIHDGRTYRPSPSAGDLTKLYDSTDERVRWYYHDEATLPDSCDLVLLDQLGVREPRGAQSHSRTPVSAGALTRIRIREDFEDARVLRESRIMVRCPSAQNIDGAIGNVCATIESLSTKDDSTSHLEFVPNQDALGRRLESATFVAVSSIRLDPACLIRGVEGRKGHLWDYELPEKFDSEEEGAGYYLIARPTEAMRRTVVEATQVISPPVAPDVDELLGEVSKRGIPILKRLAAGGSESRGELGVLLAVRLLQDCFRPPPARPRLPGFLDRSVTLLLPVDPYRDVFASLARSLSIPVRERPDLLLVTVGVSGPDQTEVRIVPIEIKYRATPVGQRELAAALEQASGFTTLLSRLWEEHLPSKLWETCARTVLAHMVDQGFRVYADRAVHGGRASEWVDAHQSTLTSILSGTARISIDRRGRLLAFGGWPATGALDLDADGSEETLVTANADCKGLLSNPQSVSASLEGGFDLLFRRPAPGPAPAATPPPAPPRLQSTDAQPTVFPGGIGQAPEPSPASTPGEAPGSTPAGRAIDLLNRPPPGTLAGPPPATEGAQAPQAGRGGRVPQEVRDAVDRGFDGFIGNREAVSVLKRELLRALLENPPHLPKNLLFTGSPSTGKTELARRVAGVLRLPLVRLAGRGLTSDERLIELLDRALEGGGQGPVPAGRDSGLPAFRYPPSVIFVDEVHLVTRPVQESLLTMLEHDDRRGVLQSRVVLMENVTFMFATTRASELDRAFKSRCTEVPLSEYSAAEVAEMVKVHHPEWDSDIRTSLAVHGRLVPRLALELADTLVAELEVTEHPERPLPEHLAEVLRTRRILPLGLMRPDIDYLLALERQTRPVGAEVVVGLIDAVDPVRVYEEIEPYLVRQGLIRLGRAGREITASGRAYLAERRRQNQLS